MWKGKLALFTCAFIWGTAFIFRSNSLTTMGPFSFNSFHFLLAALLFLPICLRRFTEFKKPQNILHGAILGILLGTGTNAQQLTLYGGNIGKTTFVTALYILFVPFLNFCLYRQKVTKHQVLALIFATLGLYAMYNGRLDFEWNDLLLLATAIVYAFQIICAERYGRCGDMISLCFYQCLCAGLVGLCPALLYEQISLSAVYQTLIPILYTGVFSIGLAYALQLYGQARVDAVSATLLMSLEAPIATISAVLVLQQRPEIHEVIGCFSIFTAIILCQLQDRRKEKKDGFTECSSSIK